MNKMNYDDNEAVFENSLRTLYNEVMITCNKFEILFQKFTHFSLLNEKLGVSLFNVKSDAMFTYINNLIYLMLKKCCGMSISDEETRERLGEIRIILEKIKPLELKLKYQIEKYIKMATTQKNDVLEKSNFRAKMENLEVNEEEFQNEENSDDESDIGESNERMPSTTSTGKMENKIYKPPKVAAVPYDDANEEEKRKKKLEQSKKRALNTSIMQELKEEYLDTPLEVSNAITLRNKLTNYQKERENYEETYFTRLPTTKKDKHRDKLMASLTVGTLGTEVTRFEDISALEERNPRNPRTANKRKTKTAIPKKNKGFKKRRTHQQKKY